MEYLGMKSYYSVRRGDFAHLAEPYGAGCETRMATARSVFCCIFHLGNSGWMYKSEAVAGQRRDEEPAAMDMKVIIMMGCVLCTTTGLCFMELRRIRKKISAK